MQRGGDGAAQLSGGGLYVGGAGARGRLSIEISRWGTRGGREDPIDQMDGGLRLQV